MKKIIALFLLLLLPALAGSQILPVPSLMSFQGRLTRPDGTPVADGVYLVRFSLWTAQTGGTEKWNQTSGNLQVKSGAFAALLSDFPAGTFNTNLWLEMKVGEEAPLPRQQLASVAYAFKADSVKDNAITTTSIADGTITGADIAAGTLTADKFAPNVLGDPTAMGLWGLNGNTLLYNDTYFIGTRNFANFDVRVYNRRVFRFMPTGISDPHEFIDYYAPNIIGGYEGNKADYVIGATIAGGGGETYLRPTGALSTEPNRVVDHYGTIGGGSANIAGNPDLTPGSGYSIYATVGGGEYNYATGRYATVPGGADNRARGHASFAAGLAATADHDYTFVWSDGTGSPRFASTAPYQFLIQAKGGVGINTNAPVGALSIASPAGTAQLDIKPGYFGNTADANWVTLDIPGIKNLYLWDNLRVAASIGTETGLTVDVNGQYDGANGNLLRFGGGGSGEGVGSKRTASGNQYGLDFYTAFTSRMVIANNGNVGIATSSPAYKLDVNGNLHCVGFSNTSDARYKRNIATFPDALEAVLNLRGVTFDWKQHDFPDMNFPSGKQIGFIAQEVEKVLPELVTTDSKGYKSVAYANVVPVLVEAIKTLKQDADEKQKHIEILKQGNAHKQQQIDEMRAELNTIKNAIEELKAQRR